MAQDAGLIAPGQKWPPTIEEAREAIKRHRAILARSWVLAAGRAAPKDL